MSGPFFKMREFFGSNPERRGKKPFSNTLENHISKLAISTGFLDNAFKQTPWKQLAFNRKQIFKMHNPYASADLGLPDLEKQINARPNFLSVLADIEEAIAKTSNISTRYITLITQWQAFKKQNADLPASEIPEKLQNFLAAVKELEKI